ncbi:MAG: hypothetical protein H6Q19_728 [Bacteroidetes bacterium]|nr:hypothetical protein [Bacteroidota bacterium]
MRKTTYFFILTVIALVLAAWVTNPDEQQHHEAARIKLGEIVENTMDDFGLKKNLLTDLGFDIGNKYIDSLLDDCISANNYLVCSTTVFTFNGQKYIIGFGAFGKVWISDKVEEGLKKEIRNGIIKNNPLFSR